MDVGVGKEKRTFGMFVKKLRKENKLSQQKLANVIGCNKSTISKIESGKTKEFDEHNLEAFLDYFKVTEEDIRDFIAGRDTETVSKINECKDKIRKFQPVSSLPFTTSRVKFNEKVKNAGKEFKKLRQLEDKENDPAFYHRYWAEHELYKSDGHGNQITYRKEVIKSLQLIWGYGADFVETFLYDEEKLIQLLRRVTVKDVKTIFQLFKLYVKEEEHEGTRNFQIIVIEYLVYFFGENTHAIKDEISIFLEVNTIIGEYYVECARYSEALEKLKFAKKQLNFINSVSSNIPNGSRHTELWNCIDNLYYIYICICEANLGLSRDAQEEIKACFEILNGLEYLREVAKEGNTYSKFAIERLEKHLRVESSLKDVI